eukprot:8418460-Pyramimonas_sp.AAC.1
MQEAPRAPWDAESGAPAPNRPSRLHVEAGPPQLRRAPAGRPITRSPPGRHDVPVARAACRAMALPLP